MKLGQVLSLALTSLIFNPVFTMPMNGGNGLIKRDFDSSSTLGLLRRGNDEDDDNDDNDDNDNDNDIEQVSKADKKQSKGDKKDKGSKGSKGSKGDKDKDDEGDSNVEPTTKGKNGKTGEKDEGDKGDEDEVKPTKGKGGKGDKDDDLTKPVKGGKGDKDDESTKPVKGGKGGSTKFTYYWIADENEFKLGSEVSIKDCKGGVLAKVSKDYWDQVHMEGSGKLRNGDFINCGDDKCNCFTKSGPSGSKGDALEIYTSLAVNDHKEGTIVSIKEFAGMKLPNGKTHNGCFKVTDVSWSFGAGQIDLYVKDKKNYEKIQAIFSGDNVTPTWDAGCTVLKYE